MSKLICPFCQQELKYDSWNEVYMCRNPNCKHLLGFGTKELWQELIRTRKALDVAKKGLKELKDVIACPPDLSYETGVSMYADGVLKEITALEQKEKQ